MSVLWWKSEASHFQKRPCKDYEHDISSSQCYNGFFSSVSAWVLGYCLSCLSLMTSLRNMSDVGVLFIPRRGQIISRSTLLRSTSLMSVFICTWLRLQWRMQRQKETKPDIAYAYNCIMLQLWLKLIETCVLVTLASFFWFRNSGSWWLRVWKGSLTMACIFLDLWSFYKGTLPATFHMFLNTQCQFRPMDRKGILFQRICTWSTRMSGGNISMITW